MRPAVLVCGLALVSSCTGDGGLFDRTEGVEEQVAGVTVEPGPTSAPQILGEPSTTIAAALGASSTVAVGVDWDYDYYRGGTPVHIWWGKHQFSFSTLLSCSLRDENCGARQEPLNGVQFPPGGEVVIAPGDVSSTVSVWLARRDTGDVVQEVTDANGNPAFQAPQAEGEYWLAIDLEGPARTLHYGGVVYVSLAAVDGPPMTLPVNMP